MSAAKITTRIHENAQLTDSAISHAWQFISGYVQVDYDYFRQQIRAHKYLIFYENNCNELVGMAAVDLYQSSFKNKRTWVFFTSNVVLHESIRGKNLIQKSGFKFFLKLRLRHPITPIFWFFDTYSYKSYLLLPKNFCEYWPRLDKHTPPEVQQYIQYLSSKHYGENWLPEKGIVKRSEHKKLKEWVAPIPENLLLDPNIRFYAESNPGYAEGDMLVCICPLNLRNWLSLLKNSLRRLFIRTARRRKLAPA